ncbi:hypothetical protein AL755_02270 (plasmid) [Arthrobacter sp. ERGS1:01]|uniref:hypothetical protein n=1 Tax=Arthrobacter sp. ERGS1:01 TaxID=1704044 RepID=UPI0006B46C9D|nr:hypothetical protein [Arthrobacter sp. ERGS1:01]ALE04517.1 hypothetical protein AL755_02270 [Arthrobacter sp. ERGS1:01]
MRTAHAPFRLLRTTAIGATILGLAAGAHLVAGGTLPVPPLMAALLALHVLCSTVVTQFRLGLPAMLALLATSQLALHQAFGFLSAGIPRGSMPSGIPLHDHSLSAEAQTSAMLQSAALLGSTGQSGAVGMDLMSHANALSGAMVPAHIVATLVTAVVLAQGEKALWALAGWLRPLYRSASAIRPLPARQARPAVAPMPLPQLPWRNLPPDPQRGPPALAAFFV